MDSVKSQKLLFLVQKAQMEANLLSQQLGEIIKNGDFDEADFIVKGSSSALATLAKTMLNVYSAKTSADLENTERKHRPRVAKH